MSITSKNQPPERGQPHLSRVGLIKTLDACRSPIILLQAGAGYGKSSLVADWLLDKKYVGWVNFDHLDNDPERFTRHLVNAVYQAIDISTTNTTYSARSDDPSPPIASISALIQALETWQGDHNIPHYLVLDNVQTLDHPDINSALKLLLNNGLSPLTIVIISRTLPNIGIANLRAKQKVVELTEQHLAFTQLETQQFIRLHFDQALNQAQCEALHRYSGGWPAALSLLVLQSNHNPDTLAQFALADSPFKPNYIWEYLAEEIFTPLPLEIQQFLLKTSIVDRFNVQLAQTITQAPRSAALIEWISRNRVFMTTLDHGWYQYHPLLLQFLAIQRQIQFGVEETSLHSLTSQAWRQQNHPTKALFHALCTEDFALISQLTEEFGWSLFHQGELGLLEQALEKIRWQGQVNTPGLTLLKAWIYQMQFRYDDVAQEIDHCLMQLASDDTEISFNIRGEFNALLAQVAITQNEPELARERAEFALLHLDHASYRARLIATSVLGEVCHVEGSLSQALSLMQQTEKYARQHQFNHQVLWALIQQIEIHTALSHSQTAYQLQSTALEYAKQCRLEHLPLFDLILRLRAKLLCDWNRLNEAEKIITDRMTQNINLSEYSHLPAILARIALLKGNPNKARNLIGAHSFDLVSRNTHLDWQAELSHSLILLWRYEKNTNALQQWLSQRVLPSQFSNHFSQQQGRNHVLALMELNRYSQAESQLQAIEKEASKYSLTCDQFRNRLLHCSLALKQKLNQAAKQHLIIALTSSLDTNYIGEFSLYSDDLVPLLEEIKSLKTNPMLLQHRIDLLLDQLAPHSNNQQAFNQDMIDQLLQLSSVPDVLKTSPLTRREWQVLTLIYQGLSNEQISYQVDIAPTTLKTHIRNLYQKLNIPNRSSAKAFAAQLLEIVSERKG
jgi:LuxR family maltose regulon positive regulatory protein